MGPARHIGRVGGLAVALGVGVAIVAGGSDAVAETGSPAGAAPAGAAEAGPAAASKPAAQRGQARRSAASPPADRDARATRSPRARAVSTARAALAPQTPEVSVTIPPMPVRNGLSFTVSDAEITDKLGKPESVQMIGEDAMRYTYRRKTFDPDNLVSFTPVSTGMFVGAASVLQLNQAASQPMFDVFRGLRPIPSPSGVEPEPAPVPVPVPGTTPGQPPTTVAPTTPTTAGITTTTLSEFIPKVPEGQTCS